MKKKQQPERSSSQLSMVPTLTISTCYEKQNKTSSVASRNIRVQTLDGHRSAGPILPEENISLVNAQYYICTRKLNLTCFVL